VLERLRRHAHESVYVARFLEEPFLSELLDDDALRQLLTMKRCAKELTEAYAAAAQVRSLLARRAGDGELLAAGAGATLIDCCSGRGLTAVLLSLLYPRARVVMLDADGGMQLAHVAARPNLTFQQLDIFSPATAAVLGAIAAGAAACVVVGTHLCGSLSPRLIDLFVSVPGVHGLVLCPCCLKGSLGADIVRTARSSRSEPYSLLVRTLELLVRSELDGGGDAADAVAGGEAMGGIPPGVKQRLVAGSRQQGQAEPSTVHVTIDRAVLSPKNAFIIAHKTAAAPRGLACGPCELEASLEASAVLSPRDVGDTE
jgi:hypothetical protein